jgi:outer membrane protein
MLNLEMMMGKQRFFVLSGLVVFLLWTGLAFSDEIDTVKEPPLALRDCIRIALEKNPSTRIALEGVISARETAGEAKAPYYPELGLQTFYKRWQSHFFLPNSLSSPGIPTIIGPTDDWMAGLNARYTLFDSGRRQAEYQGALARQGAAEEDRARTRQDLILSVHQGFYELAAALETRKVAVENLSLAQDHLRLAQERKAAGAVSKSDVLRVQVEASKARLGLVRAESQVRSSKAYLNTAMGIPAESVLNIDPRAEEMSSPESIDLSQVLDRAVQNRPEIKAALKRIQAQQEGVAAARSAYGPKVRVEGSFGWQDSNFPPKDEEFLAGIVIEWPLFTGFSRKHRLAKAKAEVFKEEAGARKILLQVKEEVMQTYSRLKETHESVQTHRVLIQDARESLRLARERYEVGAGTITDLLDAQTDLARALASQVQADWDYHLAKAALQRAQGDLTEQ